MWKSGLLSGQLRTDLGTTAWANMAGLGSIALNITEHRVMELRDQRIHLSFLPAIVHPYRCSMQPPLLTLSNIDTDYLA